MKAKKIYKIVWIDDQFFNKNFQKRIENEKIDWNVLFKYKKNNIFRLFDINFIYFTNYTDTEEFLNNEKNFLEDTYYFFIVDRYLPKKQGEYDSRQKYSKRILYKLKRLRDKYNVLDYAVLSSATRDTYMIKNIDYYQKTPHKDFHLPEELANKILYSNKNNINIIDLDSFDVKFEVRPSIKNIGIYPYIDIFKDIVDMQELNPIRKDNIYFVVTQKSTSDNFLVQNFVITFFDDLVFKKFKLNYFNQKEKELTFKFIENSIGHNEIIVIRDNWNREKFKNTLDFIYRVKRNSKYIFIFDDDDENLLKYFTEEKSAKIIKINNLINYPNTKENITLLFFDYLLKNTILKEILDDANKIEINDVNKNKLNNYIDKLKNIKLFLHPIIYRALTTDEIHIPLLDESIEIFNLLELYIKTFHDEFKEMLKNKDLFKINKKDKIYKIIKEKCEDKYLELLKDTIKFWLKNSWNVNYNANIKNAEQKWQEYSFEILKELIEEYKSELKNQLDKEIENIIGNLSSKVDKENRFIKKLSEYKNIIKKDRLSLKQFLKSIPENKNNNKIEHIIKMVDEDIEKVCISLENFEKLENETNLNFTTKINWPHNKFPIPTYIINKIEEKRNLKLHIQPKCMSNLNITKEIKDNYKAIENKNEYYESFYELVQKTKQYFPDIIEDILEDITDKIKKGENICKEISEIKNNLHNLAEAFIRISYYFFNEEIPEYYGELGKLLGKIRNELTEDNKIEELISKILTELERENKDIYNEMNNYYKEYIKNETEDKKTKYEEFFKKYRSYILGNIGNNLNFDLFQLKNSLDKEESINELMIKKDIIDEFKNLLNSKGKITNDKIEKFENDLQQQNNNSIQKFLNDIKIKLKELKDANDKDKKSTFNTSKEDLYKNFLDDLENIKNDTIKQITKLGINKELLELLNNEKVKHIINFNGTLSEIDKNYSLNYSNFIFNYSLKANITNELFNNSLEYSLLKHYGAYPLLSLLTDFRNSSVHKDKGEWIWDEELFKESFIYGYEYIWRMYEFIIKNCLEVEDKTLLKELKTLERKIIIKNKECKNKKGCNFEDFKNKLANS